MGAAAYGGNNMKVQFIGCGDAFGSGGRFNTCIHVTTGDRSFLLDCGATSVVGMKRLGIDNNAIDAIFFTHFHADHFGGIPFFLLDAQFNAKRTRPLLLVGPPGLRDWLARTTALAFPGDRTLPFELRLHEIDIGRQAALLGMTVTAFPVVHDERAGPCLSYRIEADGQIICFSGDTEWTETLVDAARDADLFICECYTFERTTKAHMSHAILSKQLPHVGAKRVVLTHMSNDMLTRMGDVEFDCAVDGMVIDV
jgi:ribonuclease BN (tRNA processing enzyme)